MLQRMQKADENVSPPAVGGKEVDEFLLLLAVDSMLELVEELLGSLHGVGAWSQHS